MLDGGLERLGDAGEKGVLLVRGYPAVYVEWLDMFVIADLHLGFEEAMASTGVFLPRVQLRNAVRLLESLSMVKPGARLVVAGDVKHAFHTLTRQERIELVKLVRSVEALGFRELVVVRGNHDNYVKNVLAPLGVEVVEPLLDLGKGVIVAHGHKKIDQDYELVVMGHEHPAITVSVGGGRSKFPVFLMVPLKDGGQALVLPPSGSYQVGNVVSTDRSSYLSPVIRERGVVEDAVPVIVDEETGLMPLVRLSLLEDLFLA
ncbi:MAG: metallophosphoesterase [Desulfurococcales archaeon]|nr:metallophosphoesterase [Desulfurococcales archaeon]